MSESKRQPGGIASLATLWRSGAMGILGDAELLGRFVDSGDESAFAALVDRHGPMVLHACRAVLREPNDAQDACQATFLVLARRAGSIRRPESLAPWLFGVARRVSLRSRDESRRRSALNRRLAAMSASARPPSPPESWADLHEEIDRLPASERSAIVLCDLESLSHDSASARLGWPVRTLRKRLYRGRDRLRARLIRRGLAPATALIGLASSIEAAPVLPASSRAESLAEGACRAMMIPSWKVVAAMLIACGGLLIGGAWAIAPRDEPKPPAAPVARPATPADQDRALLRAASRAIAEAKVPGAADSLVVVGEAQAAAGDREGALRTFRLAADEAVGPEGKPDAWELRRAAVAMIDLGAIDDARTNLRHASTFAEDGPAVHARGFSRGMILATILRSQAKIKDQPGVDATLKPLRAIYDRYNSATDWPFLGEYLAALVAAGKADEAIAQLDQMRATPGRRNDIPNALPDLVEATQDLDDDAARLMVDRVAAMPEWREGSPSQRLHLSTKLAEAQARLGRTEDARRSATSIGNDPKAGYDPTDTQPYALLVVSLQQKKRGDLEGARETLRMASRIIRDHPDMRGRSGRADQVGECQVMMGDLAGARETIALAEPGERHDTLSRIALAMTLRGEEAEARALFSGTVDDALLHLGLPPKREVPDELVFKPENAPGAKIEDQDKAFAMNELAVVLARSGEPEAAIRAMPTIQPYRRFGYQKVASARAFAGDLAGAIAMAMSLEDRAERRSALEGASEGYRWRRELLAAPGAKFRASHSTDVARFLGGMPTSSWACSPPSRGTKPCPRRRGHATQGPRIGG